MAKRARTKQAASIDATEVAQFDALAERWWDPDGPMAPLHRLHPVRMRYIQARLSGHFERATGEVRSLQGLRILDIGCGGGLATEALARLGANVTGIDPAAENIRVARAHAEASAFDVTYRTASAEVLAAADEQFDAVVSLEVLEHVADLPAFLAAAAALVRPGGALILATLNRTAKAYLFAIVGAEYVLRWLPRGTHRWDRFVTPAELRRELAMAGVELRDTVGVGFDPLARSWRLTQDRRINYMAFGVKTVR